MGKGGRPKSTNKDLTVSITTRLAEDEAAALDHRSGGRSRSAAVRLAVLAWLGMSGCGGTEVVQAPEAVAARLPACAVALTVPVQVRGADGSAGGHCDVSPYDGEPGQQVFELFSNAGGVHVRAAISRNAAQGVPLPVDGRADVWDWSHDCEEWTGTVVWKDDVSRDPDYNWIEHHDWSISLDVSCADDGYRIAGSYAGHS